MANLIKCSDCGKKVSINAHSCPKCGSILDKQIDFQDKKNKIIEKNEKEQKNIEANKRFLSLLIVLITGFFAFAMMTDNVVFGLIMFAGVILIIPPVKDLFTKKYPISRRTLNWLSFILITLGLFLGSNEAQVKQQESAEENNMEITNDISAKDTELTQSQNVNESIQPEPEIVAKDYSHVAYEITENGYPQTYARWGKKWIDDINRMMPLAVQRVAENPKCDAPSAADLSDNRSTVKQEAVFYVDCVNGERFYISQNELQNVSEVKAESDKLEGEPYQYIPACRKAVQSQLQYPSSFKEKPWSTIATKTMSGNIEVIMPFTAKNGFGNELPQTARCLITTQKDIEVTIVDR